MPEDSDDELFGYYLNTEVIENYQDISITDINSFHFNLNSKRRLKQPMKYEMKTLKYGGKYQLFDDSDKYLIRLGDIQISKTWSDKSSIFLFLYDLSFDYKNIDQPFSQYCFQHCGLCEFRVKRMIVIQMK